MTPINVLDYPKIFNPEKVRLIYSDLIKYQERFGLDLTSLQNDEAYAKSLIWKYSFCTALILSLNNGDVTGKKIMEVGPGFAGRFMLDYLMERGAEVLGVDCVNREGYSNYIGPSRGKYIEVAIEDLSKEIQDSSLDLINCKSLEPSPYPPEISYQLFNGNLVQRFFARRYVKNYDGAVANSLRRALVDGGHFIYWSKQSDYQFSQSAFTRREFTVRYLDVSRLLPGFELDIYRKSK